MSHEQCTVNCIPEAQGLQRGGIKKEFFLISCKSYDQVGNAIKSTIM